MKKKDIPLKNYIISLLIVVGVVLITFYVKKTYEMNVEASLSQSVLSRTVGEVKLDEIDTVLLEKADNYFIYLSYANDAKVYNFDKKIKNIIADYELQDNFYYVNLTDELDENILTSVNKKFNLKKGQIIELPAILFYQEGKLNKILTSCDGDLFELSDFKKILSKEYEE